MLSLFFSTAFAAETVAPASASNPIMSLLPIVVLIAVFYFFIIRPQSKKTKGESTMRNSLRIGDKIVTTSGIFGSVVQIDDKKNVISIEISKNVTVVIYKSSVAEVLSPKTQEEENGAKREKKTDETTSKNPSNLG